MVTCYDYSFGLVVNESLIDAVLVGDSVAMTVHGFESTLHADVEMMALHTRAVRRGAPDKFTVADMPFWTP
jgi:3-methyl-2-oxobutanoate hydroxymethyltransferase